MEKRLNLNVNSKWKMENGYNVRNVDVIGDYQGYLGLLDMLKRFTEYINNEKLSYLREVKCFFDNVTENELFNIWVDSDDLFDDFYDNDVEDSYNIQNLLRGITAEVRAELIKRGAY